MYCKNCGKEISEGARFCPYCGKSVADETVVDKPIRHSGSSYSRGLCMILACLGFVAISGIHRFYVGKIGTGVLWFLTGGCFGIGTLIDVIMIATGDFKDVNGLPLTDWNID